MLKLVNCRSLALKMGNDHAVKVLKIQIKVSTEISFLNYFVLLVTPCAVGIYLHIFVKSNMENLVYLKRLIFVWTEMHRTIFTAG